MSAAAGLAVKPIPSANPKTIAEPATNKFFPAILFPPAFVNQSKTD